MEKKKNVISEAEIREIVKKTIEEVLRNHRGNLPFVHEGVDFDTSKKIVSFNPSHQNNVDTNSLIHPYIIENDFGGSVIMSVFQRKDNDENRNDGNPLVYAMKGLWGWRFKSPQDEQEIFNRFVAVTKQLQEHFDTLIMTPSNNQLNNKVFGYLKDIISHTKFYSTFFEKLAANDVFSALNKDDILKYANGNRNNADMIWANLIEEFNYMSKNNNGIFSYKAIHPKYRKLVQQSMKLSSNIKNEGEYAESINAKNVLVFDDTVTTGKTLSDSASLIKETFSPRSIKFLTVFSPKTGGVFKNNRRML